MEKVVVSADSEPPGLRRSSRTRRRPARFEDYDTELYIAFVTEMWRLSQLKSLISAFNSLPLCFWFQFSRLNVMSIQLKKKWKKEVTPVPVSGTMS